MNRSIRKIIAVAALAALAGCIPEKRIVWSPDGTRAAVIATDGLHFAAPDGTLGKPLLAGARRVAWFADSKRIFCIHTTKATGWKDLEKVLTPAEREAIAKSAAGLREQVMAYNGPWDKFEPTFPPTVTSGMQTAAMIYLRDNLGDGVAKHVGATWADIEKLQPDIWRAQIFDANADAVTPGREVIVSLDEPRSPAVSPDSRFVSFLSQRSGKDNPTFDLYVAQVAGTAPPMRVAKNTAIEYTWSPDSHSLGYIYSSVEPGADHATISLGAVATIDVVDSANKPLTAPAHQEDRAGVLFNQLCAVRWLKDGRIIFSSYEVKLPATSRDMPQQWRLFVLDPRMSASALRVIPLDFTLELMKESPMFEISADGRRVLLPAPAGRVVLFDLYTADSQELITAQDPDGNLRSIPVWRGDGEACFVVPPGSPMGTPARSEIVLWKDSNNLKCLSKNWPDAAVDGWLTPERKSPTSMPIK